MSTRSFIGDVSRRESTVLYDDKGKNEEEGTERHQVDRRINLRQARDQKDYGCDDQKS